LEPQDIVSQSQHSSASGGLSTHPPQADSALIRLRRTQHSDSWPKWLEPSLLVGLLALASVLRFYDLNRLPPGLWFDEGLEGLNALSILHEQPFRIYFDNREFFREPAFGEEPLFHYLLAISIAVLGPTALALRLVSALIGVLTVGVFYGMVRTIWDRRTALLSGLLLALFRWHVHFSRTAFRTILVPLFACLFLWLWWSGIKRKRRSYLILAGVVLGLGFYTYPAFSLIVPTWFCYLVVLWWHEKDRRRQLVQGLIWPAAAALVILLPLVTYFIAHPDAVRGRAGSVSIFARKSPVQEQLAPEQRGASPAQLLVKNIWANLRHFWWRGDHVERHNVPLMAVFDPLISFIFGLGLLATIVAIRRDRRNVLVLLWAVLLSCASIFSVGAPNLLRTVGMVPAVVLILANGYLLVSDTIAKRLPRQTAVFALVVLVGWFGGNEIHRYFVVWKHHPRVPPNFNTPYRQLGEAIITSFGDADVHIPGDYYRHCSLRYLLYGRKDIYEMEIPDSLARQPNTTRDRILVYSPMTFPDFYRGHPPNRWFPRGQLVWRSDDLSLMAFQVSAEDLLAPERAAEAIRGLAINPSR